MDKPLEMTMAFLVFTLAFSFVYLMASLIYASHVNSILHQVHVGYAEATASFIALTNGNSSSNWQSWTPQDPRCINATSPWSLNVKTVVRATCFRLNGTLEVLWSKESSPPLPKPFGRAYRFIALDDGSAVKLEVLTYG